ncbi:MAG TPA: hypothetical protein VNV13_01965 [Steroidobacteraceae bacterium]|jgi:hypothetical protein|nr:hypothetical protein [Steroidobacteraceae bacterium]
MNDDDQAVTEAMPAPPQADPLELLGSMLTMINSARQCERRVREIRRETAAAVAAKAELATGHAELATARAAFEQHKTAELARIQTKADRVQARMDAAARKEYGIAEREQRIYKLEQRWKFVDEDEQVRSGFREPENGTALEKAQRAYGIDQPQDDDEGRQEIYPDPDFQNGMPPDVTLEHSRSRPARSQRARAGQ